MPGHSGCPDSDGQTCSVRTRPPVHLDRTLIGRVLRPRHRSNDITLWVNGVQTGIFGLDTKTSAYGDAPNFGGVSAGDTLVFKLINVSPGNTGPWYTDKALDADCVQHIYLSHYNVHNLIPAGTFVAFEGLPNGANRNYNDENSAFTNVALQQTDVPEPAPLALLALGTVGLRFGRKARRSQNAA